MDTGNWADPVKGSDSDDRHATLHITREEVRALVREEMLATSAEVELEPMLPSYESSVPLLSSDSNPSPHLQTDIESGQQSLETREYEAGVDMSCFSSWLRVTITLWPLVAVSTYLCLSGKDTAAIGILSFLLIWVLYGATIVFFIAACWLVGGANKTNEAKPNTQDAASSDAGPTVFGFHFCLSWMALYFFMRLWLKGPLSRAELAAAFDANISQQDALANLTACITDKITTRNATIDDFTFCLSKLGMAEIALV
ncbi:hypothetical protein EDB81DRAFT_51110 [Dactylonectria macrodidyma]|uniref:Uncharacterized protein n=1 Tax=Dactylonectria macrodidyma TaxID=307937 RepID=A0A9P9FUT6_9HYPO|nr:hypothetical protein EDB81DRAFT_51110 [Dactylonectria macrodidyma]